MTSACNVKKNEGFLILCPDPELSVTLRKQENLAFSRLPKVQKKKPE